MKIKITAHHASFIEDFSHAMDSRPITPTIASDSAMTPTQPTETHRKLACEILLEHSVSGSATKEGVIAAAQLLCDSEARAVEAITKERNELKAIVDFEVRIGARALTADDWDNMQQSLTAERERVRVLREALEFWESLRDESKGLAGFHLNGDIAEWGYFTTDPTDAALAATAEKEGSE